MKCYHERELRADHRPALTLPFFLLPFRPAADTSSAKTLVRNYFTSVVSRGYDERQEWLQRELRLTEPLVSISALSSRARRWS